MSQSDSFKEIVPLVLTGLNHFASYPCVFLLLFSNINDTFKKKKKIPKKVILLKFTALILFIFFLC